MKRVDELIERYPLLNSCKDDIICAFETLKKCFESGQKLLIAGNGGSCSDAEHIAGELMKGFKGKRAIDDEFSNALKAVDASRGKELAEKLQKGLPTIVLSNHQSLNTAFANDVENGGLFTFAQQVNVYGEQGDVLLAISTSGNAENVLNACVVAKAKKMTVVGLTGKDGGYLKKMANVSIVVPNNETYVIQEYHLPIYHCLCLMLEESLF